MKILLVHDFYQRRGATDAVVLAEKSLLEENNQEVLFYTRDNREIDCYSLERRLVLPLKSMYSWQTKREVAHIVRGFCPDVAYVHNFLPLVSPSVYHTLDSAKIPSVQAIHDFRFFCPNGLFYIRDEICERCKKGNFLHAVYRRCYRDSYFGSAICASSIAFNRMGGIFKKISGFICFTNFTKQLFLDAGVPEDKIFVKPHFVDSSVVQPRFGSGEYVLYLGRLSSEKGLWTLIAAMKQLKDIRLKIAGTGPLEQSLRRFVLEKELKNVDFVGFKTGTEKWALLRDSLFVVVPSECYETFCLVVIESYAAGKPVIGTDLGALPFVIDNGRSGLLFKAGNVDDLSAKIAYLVSNPGEMESMGRYGRKLADTRYSPMQSHKLLMNIFSCVARKSDVSRGLVTA